MDPKLQELSSSEEYQALVKQRTKIIWPLTMLMLIVYFGFVLIIAFIPEIFAQKIGDGHTSLGIASGFGVILFTFLITGVYILKANKTLEPLTHKLHEKAGE